MSMTLMVKVMKVKVGSAHRKLVLLKLADNANDKGECFPSYQHIADQCEMSRRSVVTHVKKLADDGFLWVEKRQGKKGNSSNIFHLTLPSANAAPPSETPAPPSANLALPSETPAPPPSERAAPITSHSLEPVNEPKTKGFKKPTLQEVRDFSFTNNLNTEGFHDYYTSNGWKVGRNSMKDWQAAARGWSKRQVQYSKPNQPNDIDFDSTGWSKSA